MLKIRDISLRKRILFTNFLMVCIPVVLLTLLGAAIFAGLRFTGTARQSELALLWPEKGSSMSVSYAVSSLRAKAEKKRPPKLADILEECLILEKHGIQTAVWVQDRLLYLSDGANEKAVQAAVRKKCGASPSAMAWDENTFAFTYTSGHNGTVILAAGTTPFTVPYDAAADHTLKDTLEFILFFILAISILLIIWLGVYLSRLLSRQILGPLADLRKASAEIRSGNLDYPLTVPAQDELGQTCRDFDDMRRELRNARKKQEKYEQNRKELIAGISHDLATPLTLLKGYASGIREGIARTPEKQRHYIDRIYTTACSMEKLVESLFLFSKLDLGRVPFTPDLVPIYRYFEDFVQEIAPALREQGLALALLGQDRGTVVRIDRDQFRRVIENLLINSLKYKNSSRTAVEIILREHGDTITISCVDHGAGTPSKSLSKLFDSFYRADTARTDTAKGSGLGLAIAKQIIETLGGTIEAAATPGGGLTIHMTLPVIKEGTP